MAAPIKVAHVTTIDMSLRYLLLNQLRAIAAEGYEVVGISAAGPDVPTVEAAGVRHIEVPMTRRLSPVADLVSLLRLYQVMRRERFTIVHTHTPKPNLLGQAAARLARVPVVMSTVHGFYFHDDMAPRWRRFYVFMEKIAARCSDLILSQNSEDVATAVREGIAPRSKIRLLGNGIDVTRFDRGRISAETRAALRRELEIAEGAPVVGFVGRLVAEKGILELFEAARAVLDALPAARFLVVGPTDHHKTDALSPDHAKKYGVEKAFVFTGLRQDMPEMYSLMDVFVLPSHREGFPRSPMEASAMGVPTIVTDVRGCRETVRHGVNGLLFPKQDARALAAALVEVLGDPARAAALGEGGLQMARERFDERRVFQIVLDAYEQLLAARPAPATTSRS
jgi:glycosyltransferase involved in cell wall biosynthesis